MAFEDSILLFLQDNVRNGFLTPVMKAFSFIGDNKGLVWILIALLLVIIKKTRWVGIGVGGALALSGIFTNLIIKRIVQRERPYVMIPGLTPEGEIPTDASFPSGHASAGMAAAVAFFIVLQWIMEKKKAHVLGAMIIAVSACICFSRLYLGVHYPTDVLCGLLLGIIYGIISGKVVGLIRRRFTGDVDRDTGEADEK